MKQTIGTVVAIGLIATNVVVASAEVEFTSIQRDISTFAQISVGGEEPIFEQDQQFDFDLGVFNEQSSSVADGLESFVNGVANQASVVDPETGVQAEGFIFSQAVSTDPEVFGQGFGSSRMFGTFVVDESTPVSVALTFITEGDGRASLSIIGDDFNFYRFVTDATETIEDEFVLQPGAYDFSFVALGFGTVIEEVNEDASVAFQFGIGFGNVAGTDLPFESATAGLQAFPNPARSEMSLLLPASGATPESVTIFDSAGRQVRSFQAQSGETQLSWDLRNSNGQDVPAGVYYIRPEFRTDARSDFGLDSGFDSGSGSSQPIRAVVIR